MAVSDEPVDLVVEGRVYFFMIRLFWSDLVKSFDLIEKHLVGNGICLVASLVLLGLMMFLHLHKWTKPDEQKKMLVIINIPPAIGVVSFIALQLNEDSKTLFLVLDSIKDSLAGLGIAMLMSLSLASMNFDTMKSSECVENRFPLTLILPRKHIVNQGYAKFLMYRMCQFVTISLVCSFSVIFLQHYGMYPLWFSWVFFILNVSVSLACFTVFAFFQALEEFPPCRQISRFFYIRLFSSVCFLEGPLVKVLVAMGVIKSHHFSDNLVAFEMMLFSLLQCLAFSPGPYRVLRFSPKMKSTKLAVIDQSELHELMKSHGPSRVALFSPRTKSSKLDAIGKPELDELKKKPLGPDSVSQFSPLMKSTELAAITQPEVVELKKKSLGQYSVPHSSLQRKSTKSAAIDQPKLDELKKSLGPYSVSQFSPQMKSTELAAIPRPELGELKKSSPGQYSVSQSSLQRRSTKFPAIDQPKLVRLKKKGNVNLC